MAEETVEVTIRADGTVEMSVAGIAGMACLPETQDLVDLLGGDIESQELTSEAYIQLEEEQQDRLRH